MEDSETMENTTNKSPSTKKKMSNGNRMKTCAKFGVFDCSCCQIELNMSNEIDKNERIVHDKLEHDTNIATVKEEQLYLPSTSTSAVKNADLQSYIHSVTADEEKKYEEMFLKLMKREPIAAAAPEEEEIDVVNESPVNFPTDEAETFEQRETSISSVFDTSEENVQIERDSNVIVNETLNSVTDEVNEADNMEEEIDVVNETENTEEEIDVVNEAPPVEIVIQKRARVTQEPPIEEEINVVDEIDENAPLSTFITRNAPKRSKRRKLLRNPVIEDEIIDVVNLTDESSNLASLSTALVNSNRNIVKKHRTRQQSVINDSIIEISDSPIAPKIISEVINIDDDELSQNNADSPTKGPSLGSCPVCMEEFTKCEIMSTMCGHIFCAMCIKTVIKTTKKCPKCRKHLTLKSIHPLFI